MNVRDLIRSDLAEDHKGEGEGEDWDGESRNLHGRLRG